MKALFCWEKKTGTKWKFCIQRDFWAWIVYALFFDSAAIERSIWQPLNHLVLSFHQYQCSILLPYEYSVLTLCQTLLYEYFVLFCSVIHILNPLFSTLSILCCYSHCVSKKIKWRKQRIWLKNVHWNRKNALEYLCAWKWRAFFPPMNLSFTFFMTQAL